MSISSSPAELRNAEATWTANRVLTYRTDRFTDGWKAWFCFDDLFVALGAAITAPSSAYPVVTTIDQRLAEGSLTAGPDPDHPGYVHHGRVGYVPLAAHESVFATMEPRTGCWSDVSETGSAVPLSAEVFCVGFDHSPRPDGAPYACLILPGADATATAVRSVIPASRCYRTQPSCSRSTATTTASLSPSGTTRTGSPRPQTHDCEWDSQIDHRLSMLTRTSLVVDGSVVNEQDFS